MATTPKFDTISAVKTIESTSFDSPENRAAREFLRRQMNDAARDDFDDAVAALRKSLGTLSAEERSAYRGFRCSTSTEPGRGVRFVVTLGAPADVLPALEHGGGRNEF